MAASTTAAPWSIAPALQRAGLSEKFVQAIGFVEGLCDGSKRVEIGIDVVRQSLDDVGKISPGAGVELDQRSCPAILVLAILRDNWVRAKQAA